MNIPHNASTKLQSNKQPEEKSHNSNFVTRLPSQVHDAQRSPTNTLPGCLLHVTWSEAEAIVAQNLRGC